MDSKEAEFLKRIMATFRVEAQEHIQNLSAGLLELEKAPEPARGAELIEIVFRETHSLKGAARSVDQREIEALCQPMESAFAALKRNQLVLTTAMCDLFHQAVDCMSRIMAAPVGKPTAPDRTRQRELIRQLGEAAQASAPSGGSPALAPPAQAPASECPVPPPLASQEEVKPGLGESVRIPTAKMDPLLLQAEEMILAKMAATQRVGDMREILQGLSAWKKEWGQRPDRQPSCPNPAMGEAHFNALQHRLESLAGALAEDQRAVKRMVDEHLEAMKKVLMLPVASLVEVLPKFVRDLSRDQGKEVALVLQGTDIEIEKRVLDEMKGPLIHLLRNCIDHGIQKPALRQQHHKPTRGTITLAFAAKESGQVEVILSDDGVGIDLDKVRAVAVNKGIVSAEAVSKLSPRQTLALIFQSGVSTSPIITDISGRGLGLAIVREKVEKLGGMVSVEAHSQEGANFRLLLPMTLATFRGILVRVDEHQFLLPTVNVQRALRVSLAEIKTVENQQTITLDGEVLSLVRLGRCLGLPERPQPSPRPNALATDTSAPQRVPALVLSSADKRMVFQVDEVLDEQQVLLKGLGRQLRRVRNIAGATVLGSGRVVPVINVLDLMASALRPRAGAMGQPTRPEPERPGRILVVEDSITARTLIKSILETAGYQVTTAVDGMDAFTQLRSQEFDLVVSDVDMPRLNGFELTAKIRGDRKLAELPVVLVTALESREDRERGIEVEADAYMVKSSFDQSNLLGLIRKML
ncbi:MAG: response regulator [Pseudomonadota bacterium]